MSARSQPQRRVDGLATVISEDDDSCLYGESSTIAFVRQVTRGARANDTAVLTSDQEDTTVYESGQTSSDTVLLPLDIQLSTSQNLAVLPLRRTADNFLHCFWEFVHLLFPVIHKTSFIAKYDQLWLPIDTPMSDDEEIIFVSNINLVFALGCQFSGQVPSDQKVSTANEFYKRSRHVLLYDILGSASVSVIQWLLLSGIYLQSTRHASHCWNSVGLAIRLAQGLGLHLENPARRSENQLNREMRRRIWHTCVVLDRYVQPSRP